MKAFRLAIFLLMPFIVRPEAAGQDMIQPQWVTAVAQDMSPDFKNTPAFRLPKMVVCSNGDIVIGCEAKEFANRGRASFHALSISTDGGMTFKAKRSEVPVHELVYDAINDRILSYYGKTFYASDDHGNTWYDYKSVINTRLPQGFDEVSMSPTSGIQLRNGILAIPLRAIKHDRDNNGNKKVSIEKEVVFVLYSKDFGKNWYQSPWTDENIIADEVVIVEYADNQIMLNARGGTEFSWEKTNNGRRVFIPIIKSKSDIDKWEVKGWKREKRSDGQIYDPICHASIIKTKINGKTVALLCNPDMPGEYWPRKNLVIRASKDFKRWKKAVQLTPDGYPVLGYSALASYKDNIYFLYEDESKGIQFCNLNAYKDIINKTII